MVRTEAEAWLKERIALKQRHTDECREAFAAKGVVLREWDQHTDKRKQRCACPYWSCGVHGPAEKFRRKATGALSLERAEAVVLARLIAESDDATPEDETRIPIKRAINEYMQYTKDGGAKPSTVSKYETLMDQLQAYCDFKGIEHIRQFDQDVMVDFRRAWSDKDAGYKQTRLRKDKRRLWTTMSEATAQRSAKTMKYFFNFCILRKWLKENPTDVLRFAKADNNGKKRKSEVKYLTPEQMTAILSACDKFERMPSANRQRLKALILTMRYTGLRLSDATTLTADEIKGDVLFLRTKKSSTDVQVPLPPVLVETLKKLPVYKGGLLFWNRQKEDTDPATVRANFTMLLQKVFRKAKVKEPGDRKLSHMFRNTFAVDLLEKGVPLETVSLMLGHKSVTTTERAYADFTEGYMQRAEEMVRKRWAMTAGQSLEVVVGRS